MREILFRGKRIEDGEWVEGDFLAPVFECIPWILPRGEGEEVKVDPYTVGQYTGLCDKNGKKIFEGDIVVYDNSPYNAYCTPQLGEIAWRNGSLCFKYRPWASVMYRALCSDDFFAAKCEVIGNIHDNQELLEVSHEQ